MTAVLERPVTTVRYEPRGGVKELFQNREQLVMCTGPAGTGKTLGALMKLHLACLQVKRLKGLIVRQTLVSLTGTTLVTFEEQVINKAIEQGLVTWFGGSTRTPPGYRYRDTKAFIAVGGLDKATKLLGGEYDRIVVDEAVETTPEAIETLLMRLRGVAKCYKQLILLCNPDAPSHWLLQRHRAGNLPMIESRHLDNPAFVNRDGSFTERGTEYFQKLDALTGVRRLRYRDGVWAAAEGVIFDEWDPTIHHIETPTFSESTRLCARGLPWNWTRYYSIDFGFTHPTVIQRWAEDSDGRLYLYAEQFMTQRTVEQHVEALKAQLFDEGGVRREPVPRVILADHDAEDRATFHKHFGTQTQAAHKAVKPGIEAVKSRLKPAGDGKPRLYILKNSLYELDRLQVDAKRPTCTADEFGGYIWNEQKDAPIKEQDDGLDALRYVVAHRDLRGTTRVRFIR